VLHGKMAEVISRGDHNDSNAGSAIVECRVIALVSNIALPRYSAGEMSTILM